MSEHQSFEEKLAHAIATAVNEVIAPLRREIIAIKMENAELQGQVKSLQEGGLHYRGVYEDGQAYQIGDACTSGGSMWRAQASTTFKPGQSTDWKLVVRKGRDARDLTNGHRSS
jgi:hypothetical protein